MTITPQGFTFLFVATVIGAIASAAFGYVAYLGVKGKGTKEERVMIILRQMGVGFIGGFTWTLLIIWMLSPWLIPKSPSTPSSSSTL